MPTANVVSVTCSRCGRTIEGMEFEEGTAGFYRVQGTIWQKYANDHEQILCDGCMWTDERYLADYPFMRGATADEVKHG
jgi:hypothetical protein